MHRCPGTLSLGDVLTAQVIEKLGVDFGPRQRTDCNESIRSRRLSRGRGDLNALNRRLIVSSGRTLGATLATPRP